MNRGVILRKERVAALAGGTFSVLLVVLAVGESLSPWIRWGCMVAGLMLIPLLVGSAGALRLDLLESRQELRHVRNQRDELERYFHALMDSVPSGIYFKDRDSRFLQVNHYMAETLGAATQQDMIGKSDRDYFHEEHARQARQDEVAIMETGEGFEKFVEKETFPNGTEGWVLSSKLPFRDKNGRIIGTFGLSSDVTELIKTQQILERERNMLRTLLDGIPDSIYVRDFAGHYMVVNRALANLVGCPDPKDVAGKTPYDFFPEEQARAYLEEDAKLMEGGEQIINPASILRNADGDVRHLVTTKVPVRDSDGRVFGIVGINRDVTEQERAREALRQTEHRMQEIVDNSPSPMYAKSVSGHYLMINREFEDLFRVKSSEVVGKSVAEVIQDEALAARIQANDKLVLARGKPMQFDEMLHHPDGDRAYVSVRFPMRDLDGEIYAVGGISTEITERKKAEQALQDLNQELLRAHDNLTRAHEQLIQAEKMESVGRLAAGVAHEVKNPLAMIGMGLELLSRRLPENDAKGRETIDRMKRGIDRAKKIVRGLVDFSSERRFELVPLDPNLLVEESLELVEYELEKAGVAIEFTPAAALPPVEVDQTKIEQVLVNLFINAMHSMDGGGTLSVQVDPISMENVAHDEGSRLRERMREGDRMVRIRVADTGKGIPEEALGKLFDPFFTTKATGKGTGLGLSVSRKIAELHGGELSLTNRKDRQGAVAELTLRVSKD